MKRVHVFGFILVAIVAVIINAAVNDHYHPQSAADSAPSLYSKVCQTLAAADSSVSALQCVSEMEQGAAEAKRVPTRAECDAYRQQLKEGEWVDGYHLENSPQHTKFMLKKYGCTTKAQGVN